LDGVVVELVGLVIRNLILFHDFDLVLGVEGGLVHAALCCPVFHWGCPSRSARQPFLGELCAVAQL